MNVLKRISVTILTKDSQKYIGECLKALGAFDEVLILDNGSRDRTLEIARTFSNVRILEHPFIGFGPMKNLAAKKAKNDWILSVDSDEVLTSELLKALERLELKASDIVYAIDRLNHYRGRPIRCCGWYPDRVLRLYNRKAVAFNDALVHESLKLPPHARTKRLDGTLLHYPFDDVASLIEKMQRYSTLYAQTSSRSASPAKAFFRALFAFVKHYFFQRGFLCGYPGLLISVSNANGVFYKYMKRYETLQEPGR